MGKVYCILCDQYKGATDEDVTVEGFSYVYCSECRAKRGNGEFYGLYVEAMRRMNLRDRSRRYYNLTERQEYMRVWRQENREIIRIHSANSRHKRRARLADLESAFSTDDWQRAIDYFDGRCAVCGRPLDDLFGEHVAAMDHWIPISYEGDNPGHVAWNIVPLCHGIDGCNNSKHNVLPEEWLLKSYTPRMTGRILDRIERYFEWIKSQQK